MKRLLVAVAIAAFTLVACAAILDIEELPVRLPEADANGDATIAADAGDATAEAACVELAKTGCTCPHAFCDDFDHDDGGPVGEGWLSAVTPAGGPFVREREDGGVIFGSTDASVSPPLALSVRLSSDQGNQYALLLHKLIHDAGPTFAGVRYRFLTRVRELQFTEVQGPLPDAGSAFLAGIILEKFPPAGVLLIIAEEGIYLAVNSQDIFEGAGATGVTPIVEDRKISTIFGQSVEGEIIVTTKERAKKESYDKCDAVDAPYVVGMRIGGALQGCVAMPTDFGDLSWTATPVIGLGAGAFADGTVDVVHDNARVDFLE